MCAFSPKAHSAQNLLACEGLLHLYNMSLGVRPIGHFCLEGRERALTAFCQSIRESLTPWMNLHGDCGVSNGPPRRTGESRESSSHFREGAEAADETGPGGGV